MATLRLHLLLASVLVAAAGCAYQPAKTDQKAPGATSTGSVPATAPANSAAAAASIQAMKKAVSPDLLMFAHDEGYNQVVIKGTSYYFCKLEDPMGSIIPVRQCINQSQLEFLRSQVEQQQQQLRKPGVVTGQNPP